MLTWDDLAALTLARQFPSAVADVVDLVGQVGPIQSQVARAPFVTVSSRMPGGTYAEMTSAYESRAIVRGSNLRATVHTCVRAQHPLLDAVTRRAMDKVWHRGLKLVETTPAQIQAAQERYALDQGRTQSQLRTFLIDWLAAHDPTVAPPYRGGPGQAMAHIHSGMLRLPSSGGWDQQTAPIYRTASAVLDEPADLRPLDPSTALTDLARSYFRAFGPATRYDFAWWTGEKLSDVDTAIAALGDSLTRTPGPSGREYLDVADPPAARADPGVRLLPEYDALLIAYASDGGRDRFGSQSVYEHIGRSRNGVFDPLVLVDGRLRATWRLPKSGDGAIVEVTPLPGLRTVSEDELAPQAAALAAALDLEVIDVRVTP